MTTTPVTQSRVLDLAIKGNVAGFNTGGYASCSIRVYPIDGAWPQDSTPAAMELEFVVSVDGYSWGTVSGKGSNFSAAGFQEIDVTDNRWIGLRVVTPGGVASFPASPKQVEIEFTPRGGAAEDEAYRGSSVVDRLSERLGGEAFAPIRTIV